MLLDVGGSIRVVELCHGAAVCLSSSGHVCLPRSRIHFFRSLSPQPEPFLTPASAAMPRLPRSSPARGSKNFLARRGLGDNLHPGGMHDAIIASARVRSG